MPSRTLPNLGLKAFFDLGEDGWNDEVDLNTLITSVCTQGVVNDVVAATPGSPTDGQVFLFTSAHPTQANKVAIRDAGAWIYVTPQEGWNFYNLANDTYYYFNATTWADLAIGPPLAEQVPSLNLGWIGLGGGYKNPAYRKTRDGLVHIYGAMQRASSASDGVIFTLLAGYRPSEDLIFVCHSAGGAYRVNVQADGDVEVSGSNMFYSSFSGISFFAA